MRNNTKSVPFLFDEKEGLTKTVIKTERRKKVNTNIKITKGLDVYLDRYKRTKGTTKAAAAQILVIKALQKRGLLSDNVRPVGEMIAKSGRNSYSDSAEIIVTVKVPIEVRNAVIKYRIDNGLNATLAELLVSFVTEGLEVEGFLQKVKTID